MKFEEVIWEQVNDAPGANTERLKVPGGWIYQIGYKHNRPAFATSVFVPEPDKCPCHPNQILYKTCHQCKLDRDEI